MASRLRCGTSTFPGNKVHGRKKTLQYLLLYWLLCLCAGIANPSMTTTSGRCFRSNTQEFRKCSISASFTWCVAKTPTRFGGNNAYSAPGIGSTTTKCLPGSAMLLLVCASLYAGEPASFSPAGVHLVRGVCPLLAYCCGSSSATHRQYFKNSYADNNFHGCSKGRKPYA